MHGTECGTSLQHHNTVLTWKGVAIGALVQYMTAWTLCVPISASQTFADMCITVLLAPPPLHTHTTHTRITQALKPLIEKLAAMSPEERATGFSWQEDVSGRLNAVHMAHIGKLYAESGPQLLDLLQKNPAVAIPVVYARLQAKDVEWCVQLMCGACACYLVVFAGVGGRGGRSSDARVL